MKSKKVPVLITIALILIIGGITLIGIMRSWISGTTERLDYNKTMSLSDGQYTVIVNNTLMEFKAETYNGMIYISTNDVAASVNDGFYWDETEKIFIYTTATKVIKAYPGEKAYHIGEEVVSLDYEPITNINDQLCVALDYIKLYTQCEVQAYNDPNRLVFVTEWGDKQIMEITKDTVMRYRGGPRSEVMRDLTVGEKVYLIQLEEDWSWVNVASSDGYIGWVKKADLSAASAQATTAPAFEEEPFTYISKPFRINMAWHQVTSTDSSTSSALDQALNNTVGINVVSPTWFNFADMSGGITSLASYEYVQNAHSRGIEVWALIQNTMKPGGEMNGPKTDELLKVTSIRETLINNLIAKVLEYGIDGINVDFEMIEESGADSYIQFIRELSVKCRLNNIVLSIDNYVPLYTKHYNRSEQAKFADYLVIMGYDEHVYADDPGPVASVGFVEQGIKDTLEVVDASKVINAIPLYSRYWEEATNGAKIVYDAGMSEALSYLTSHDVSPAYNTEFGCSTGSYKSDLNGSVFTFWLEDAISVENKMKLIQQYQLAGVASWKLGLESGIEIWQIINAYLQY